MRRGLKFGLWLVLAWLFVPGMVCRAEEPAVAGMAKVLERYRSLVCGARPPAPDALRKYADSLSADGSWPDVSYADHAMAGWTTITHLNRIREMAYGLAVDRKSQKDETKVRQAMDRALDNWCAKRYQSRNWWYNEIGVPGVAREIIVLLGDDLKGERKKAALAVMGQFKMAAGGANLMWGAELALHHGCLTENQKLVAEAAQRMWAEIAVGKRDGIQSDGSFYQHGPRLQTFHYGAGYLDVVAKIAWQLRQTPWAIPEAKRDLISNYILDGPQWMRRGAFTVPGTIDRAVSRQGSLTSGNLAGALHWWQEVDPARSNEFKAVIARQAGAGAPLLGYRHFPKGDFTVYHRPKASVFLKTLSDRTSQTESINSENLKGVPYLNCGDHYVLQDGQEYHNLQPVWQWNSLPGLTMLPEDTKPKRNRFVGGIGNGESGMTAMDYAREGPNGVSLAVRKTWFFHGDMVVCLIGGMEAGDSQGAVVTALEQCRLRGPVKAGIGKARGVELKPGDQDLSDVRWILHNQIGYIPINMAGVHVFIGERTGDWHSIANQFSTNKVTEKVLHILAQHGQKNRSRGWAIMLDASEQKLDAIATSPPCRIVRNEGDGQCVQFRDGLWMAAFFAAGSAGKDVSVDKPCLAMWTKSRMWLCDPTMAGEDVALDWRQQPQVVKLPPGAKVEQVAWHAPANPSR